MSILLCNQYQRGIPMKDRNQTVTVVKTLLGEIDFEPDNNAIAATTSVRKEDLSGVYGDGPLLLSDIPKSCYRRPIVLGIDEAGRGSVIGPMIYGMAYWYANAQDDDDDVCEVTIPKDFNDSKQLNEGQRNVLFDTILQSADIGFGIRIFSASEISRNMLRASVPYNLNQMSHDGAISLIRSLLLHNQQDIVIQTCYIDTVGNAASYQRRLEQEFPGIEFIVESKADDTYPPCSAASIVAKVVRDRMIHNCTFYEPLLNGPNQLKCISTKFGSGYPSDPTCKDWLNDHSNIDQIFTYPNIVRFSWAPIKKLIEQKQQPENNKDSFIIPMEFAADRDNENDEMDEENHKIILGIKRQQEQMNVFLGKKSTVQQTPQPKKRLPFFEVRKLQTVVQL